MVEPHPKNYVLQAEKGERGCLEFKTKDTGRRE